MTDRAGDSAATVRSGEASKRRAEDTGPAPALDAVNNADNIADIDSALSEVAEDLARLGDAADDGARQLTPSAGPSPAHRGGASIVDALGDAATELGGKPPARGAHAALEALDEELERLSPRLEPPEPITEEVEQTIGQIFHTKASAVQHAPPPDANGGGYGSDGSTTTIEPVSGEETSQVEIEEVEAPEGDFGAPEPLMDGSFDAAPSTTSFDAAPKEESQSTFVESVKGPRRKGEKLPEDEDDARRAPPAPEDDAAEMSAPAASPAPEEALDEQAEAEINDEIAAAEAPGAAPAAPNERLAAAAEAAAAEREALKLQPEPRSRFGFLSRLLVAILVFLNRPFGKLSRQMRDTLGLLGAGTLFNAMCAWIYWIISH